MYTIINQSDLASINFSELNTTDFFCDDAAIRLNNDGTLALVEFPGTEPASLASITKVTTEGRDFHTQAELVAILSDQSAAGWTISE